MATTLETLQPCFDMQPAGPAGETDADAAVRRDRYYAANWVQLMAGETSSEITTLTALAAAAVASGDKQPELYEAFRAALGGTVDANVATGVETFLAAAGLQVVP